MLNQHFSLYTEGAMTNTDKEAVIHKLITDYSEQVYLLAYTYVKDHGLAQDIAQDVFYKCYRHLHKYRGEAPLKSWIYRITINTSKDYLKKKSFNVLKFSKEMFENMLWTNSTENTAIQKDEAENILQCVLSLKQKYREVIILHYFQEMKVNEIKEVLHINANTVKTRLSRGRSLLKEKLKNMERGDFNG